jgi:quinol monooxygenase YgiN
MGKLALIATIKTVPGKREEYLNHLRAHSQGYFAKEPGTLKFEIMVPHDQADTVILYEVYASPEAFETHWRGPAKQGSQSRFGALKGQRQCCALQSR